MKAIKIVKLIMAAMSLMMPFLGLAKTETVNGITWTYTVTNGKASIGNGTSSAVSPYLLESTVITVPSELGGYPVTSIGANAFKECQKLRKVTLPDTVTSIGSNAFYWCTSLRSMTIPRAVTSIGDHAFEWCSELTNVNLSASLTTIGSSAFFDCAKLGHVTVPASVTSIGKYAFLSCDSLRRVDITDLAAWCRISFGDGTANPLHYSHNLYLNGTLIKELSIPNSVNSIKNYAFEGWGWYDGVDRPVSVIIPNSVLSIGTSAFELCSGLTRVTIGNGVKSIGNSAFAKCRCLSNVTMGNGVTSIGNSSFYHCDRLSNIVLPNSVISIGNYAFQYCGSLTDMVLPDLVANVGNWAFNDCSALTSVMIGNSVTSIGISAFNGCSALTNVTMKGDCPTVGTSAFNGVGDFHECVAWLPNGNTTYSVTNNKWQNMKVKYYNGFYTITFDANGGVGGTSMTLEYGTAIGAPTVTWDGYVFDGWLPNVAATVPARNVMYKAQWKPRQYMVTFDANGGMGGTNTLMDYGTSISAPTVLRTGYTFAGWSPSLANTVPANDVTYVAQWSTNDYVIAYNANGGAGTMPVTTATYDEDTTLAVNGFTCYGKQFAGWATESGGQVVYSAGQKVRNLTSEANGTIMLYAVWETLIVPSTQVSTVAGTTFCGDSCTVTLSCPLDGATIYYTTNGVTPRTSAAFAYTEPIVIYGSADIVAIAVKDGERSGYTRVSIVQIAPTAPVIMPADGTEFRSETCEVSISCETDGAEIYYTLDGSIPQKGNGTKYTEPFTIADTATIRAIAVGGPLNSEVVMATLTKRSLSLAEAAGAIELPFETDESAPWYPILDASSEKGFAAQSGAIGMNTSTWMETSVRGSGVFSFKWRVECEKDDSGQATWDRLMVFTNGVEATRIDGNTEWLDMSLHFGDQGKHTIRWEFLKDDYDDEGAAIADSAWVGSVSWMGDDPIPAIEETSELSWALSRTQDKLKLADKLSTIAEYNAFRDWVDNKSFMHQIVADSPNAWLAYAFDSVELMVKANALTSEDVVIESFTPSAGVFDLVVGIENVEIGTGARLAEALGVEGAVELSESAFSSEGLSVILERTVDGKAKATVTPTGSPSSFFMRVKVK